MGVKKGLCTDVPDGGGARLVDVDKYVQNQLGLPTEKGNPFSQVQHPSGLQPLLGDLRTVLATAIGLGLKSDL